MCRIEACSVNGMQGKDSDWDVLLEALPKSVPSPVFWPPDQQQELLRGSKVLKEAQDRAAALQMEWAAIHERVSADPSKYDPSGRVSASANNGTALVALRVPSTMLLCISGS